MQMQKTRVRGNAANSADTSPVRSAAKLRLSRLAENQLTSVGTKLIRLHALEPTPPVCAGLSWLRAPDSRG
jgi:hypothetical protein